MTIFSRRNNINSGNFDILRNRLLLVVYENDVKPVEQVWLCDIDGFDFEETVAEKLLKHLGYIGIIKTGSDCHLINFHKLCNVLESVEWYHTFDTIERYLTLVGKKRLGNIVQQLNNVFEEERAEWIIKDNKIISRLDPVEYDSVESVCSTVHLGDAGRYIDKAVSLLSRRPDPDYLNSIKESISAVEAACKYITGLKNASLGQALSALKDVGVVIPETLKIAFDKLYGYTCQEGGIRHAGLSFSTASYDEARFMLVVCSAFINFLDSKYKVAKRG